MLRLTLLCHGATAATRAAAFPADEPLEPRAAAEAARLSLDLARTPVRVSPALRARQTAEALGVAAEVDPGLRDVDCGRWAGEALAAVIAREPEAFAAFMSDPRARPHGGESVADLVERIAAWLAAPPVAEGRLVAVTHGAVIRAALVGVLAAPLEAFWKIDVAPLSAVELSSDGRRWAWRAGRSAP